MSPRRARLAARLREVRAAHFPSGNAFAQEIGWAQSRVSKLETGAQLPTEQDVRAWVRVCRETDTVADELLALLADTRIEHVSSRDLQRAGELATYQAKIAEREARATRLCDWQPDTVPGLVQTTDYMRDLQSLPGGMRSFGSTDDDVETWVAERVRRQNVLYQRNKTITLVTTEHALLTPPRSAEVLRAQLDRLITISGLDTVTLGVLPLGAPMPVMPYPNFTIYDDDLATVELPTREFEVTEPTDLKSFRDCFEHLLAAVAVDADAVALIQRLLA